MGIITKIEDKLGDIVEKPFRVTNGFNSLSIEICLKRVMELKRRNILGKVVVPNDLIIVINKKLHEEYEPFLNRFKKKLVEGLNGWMKEKGYELAGKMSLDLKGGPLKDKPFEVFISYKKANSGNGSKANTDLNSSGQKDAREENKIIVGELVNKKTGEWFRIDQSTMVIGRGEDCTIKVSDPTISRKHASLSYRFGKVTLEDLKTKSGTRVNHERIYKKILIHGDTIIIGRMKLTYVEAERISTEQCVI